MPFRSYARWVLAVVGLLVALLWATTASAAPAQARPTPHPIEGRSACLTCHAPGTPSAVPADHSGRTDATCVACHQAEPVTAESTPAQRAGKNDTCLGCHSNKDMAFSLADGTKVSGYVNPESFKASVHGTKDLACADCHANITGFPHPPKEGSTRRDFSLKMDELCQKCHSEDYKKSNDGVHAALIADGNESAPGCTDCHGVHDISNPTQTAQKPAETCAKCHGDVYDEYRASVHGNGRQVDANPDLPTCTTCHGVHDMADPRTAEFHVESPDLCAKCHADQPLMAEYGLSSQVVQTYKAEFHGVTTEMYKTRYPTVWCYKAVCTDCHGVHGIRRTEDAASTVHESNLPETCGQCHPGASANFAGAWIGHYEPSPTNSPLVYYVNLFYQIVIPLLVLSLLAFIGLDVYRRVANRMRP